VSDRLHFISLKIKNRLFGLLFWPLQRVFLRLLFVVYMIVLLKAQPWPPRSMTLETGLRHQPLTHQWSLHQAHHCHIVTRPLTIVTRARDHPLHFGLAVLPIKWGAHRLHLLLYFRGHLECNSYLASCWCLVSSLLHLGLALGQTPATTIRCLSSSQRCCCCHSNSVLASRHVFLLHIIHP